ncbi:MAG: SRPBCC family protein [Thermoleophilia bacterium]|jgi:carbon monoxide dehydrogenase subunit G|nr:SRPBCC family protein [Thermoleophilia bacterium]
MANDLTRSVHVEAPPAAVWALVGDPARVPDWFPPITACAVEGDLRRVTTAQGMTLVERLTDRDDAAMTYAYSVVEGNPRLATHRASITVTAAGEGARVDWRQQATSGDPEFDLERRLGRVMESGLANLKAVIEGAG